MPISVTRRPGTSSSFWNKHNKAQDALVAAVMPSLRSTFTAPSRPSRDVRSVHPDFSALKVYSV